MTKSADKSAVCKSRGFVILEYVLLGLCLCVIALRTTITEGINVQSSNLMFDFSGDLFKLSISGVLIFAFGIWLIVSVCGRKFSYRLTGMEIGAAAFAVAAILAGLAASNKRAAINDFAVMIGPILMAVLLVQILDTKAKIRIVLIVIAALGIVSAYQCASQFFVENKIMIEQYESDPQSMLGPLNLEAGSFEHMLFEHRIYSKDIRGFFSTGNSAGSFFILSLFAGVGLLVEKLTARKSGAVEAVSIFTGVVAIAAILVGLGLTHSKGAIIAAVVGGSVFIVCLLFGGRLARYKTLIIIVLLLGILGGGFVVVSYGLGHERLPGGNSMLVRWQYWQASVRMYADHWVRGVGPGNFVTYYTHYKPAAAIETVADPHNFVLTILTQYGPVGLIGFLAVMLVPLLRTIYGRDEQMPSAGDGGGFAKLAGITLTIVAVVLLIGRAMISPLEGVLAESLDQMIYVLFVMYGGPVIVFGVGCWLMTTRLSEIDSGGSEIFGWKVLAGLCCAVFAVLLHNLVDFALFEPGVLTSFFAIIACIIAMDFQRSGRREYCVSSGRLLRIGVIGAVFIVGAGYLCYVLGPVGESTDRFKGARKAYQNGQMERATNILTVAAASDRFSPNALSFHARVCIAKYIRYGARERQSLYDAERSLLAAIELNPEGFKDYVKLTEVYLLLGEGAKDSRRIEWFGKGMDSITGAIERYPGSGRLRVSAGEIAEKLGKIEYAQEQYTKAVEIEDAYREQFVEMYPGRTVFSRLGEEGYQLAKQRIAELSK